MARVIEAVQIFKKVEDATSPKDDPPPVYLMDELADMARGSFESAEKIAGRIAKRLENKSPIVKYKALRLTRHIANKGYGNFQRAMQKHASAVRALMHFKGEPDPFKGDTPNQRVRDAAKEATEALANTVMAQPVSSLGSRIQGFGSGAAPAQSSSYSNSSSHHSSAGGNGNAGGGSGSASTGRMAGFGSNSYGPPTGAGGGGAAGNGVAFGSSQRGVNRPLTGGYGGDAGGSGAGHSDGGYGGGYSAPAVAAADVLGSEDQLVESICTPGGLRLAPDPDDLRRFVEAVGSLDGLRVAELLRDKMDGSGPWQQMLRALHALEAVLLQGATQACGEIAVVFQSDPTPVQAAAASPQAPVRDRAAQVLKLLLGDDALAAAQQAAPAGPAGRGAAAPPAGAQAPAPAAPVDLLGGLDMLGTPVQGGYNAQPSGQQQQPQPVQKQQGPEDIFSNLTVPSANPPHASSSFQPQLVAGGYGMQAQQQQHLPPYAGHGTGAMPAGLQGQDPFGVDVLRPSAATPMYPSGPQPQQQHYQQHQQQHQPTQQHGQGAAPGGGGMGWAGPGAPGPGPSHTSVRPPVAQAPQPRNLAAPLDDLFSDMSLSGGQVAAGGASDGPSYGGGGAYGSAYGMGTGPAQGGAVTAYGGPANRMPPSGVAAPGSYASVSGQAQSGMGGSKPGSQVDLLGAGGGAAQVGQYGAQYGGPVVGVAQSGGAAMQPQRQPYAQQPPVQPAPGPGPGAASGDLLGGYDVGLRPGPPAAGPSGGIGMGGGGYGAGVGMGGGVGMGMGLGSGMAAPGSGIGAGAGMGAGTPAGGGMGMGAGAVGGMMVGPGGQVRYVGGGGPMQGSMGVGAGYPAYGAPGGGVGGGLPQAGPSGPTPGSWQQPYGAPQGNLAGQQHQQQQQRGPAAFDFVMDHFK